MYPSVVVKAHIPKKAPTMDVRIPLKSQWRCQNPNSTNTLGGARKNNKTSTKLDKNANQGTRWRVLCLSWDCTSLPTASKFCCDSEEPAGMDHKDDLLVLCRRWARSVRLWVGKGVVGALLVWDPWKAESSKSPNGGLPRIRISSISIQA